MEVSYELIWRFSTVASSLSSKKRIRQNKTRRLINSARKSALKTLTRKFTDAVTANDTAVAETEFINLTKALDQDCTIGVMHKKQASRRKSRMQKRLNAIMTST